MQRALLLLRAGARHNQPWPSFKLPTDQNASLPGRLLLSTANSAPAQPPPPETVAFSKRQLKWYLGLGTAGTLAVSAYSAESDKLKLAWDVPTRLIRDCATALVMIVDYWQVLSAGYEGEERRQQLSDCHERGAERLLQLCFANGGVYTKLGQHVGQLDRLLPEEYVLKMRNNLLDRCPVSSYKEVAKIVKQDLGEDPEKLFKRFDRTPIASASLAQVHVAYDHAGNKLAVKVQHEGLRESAQADITTIQGLVNVAKFLFPTFDYQWLVDEIKLNLPLELDFEHEAQNAERCRANFNSKRSKLRGRVHIPDIYHDKSSHRVLTMEFVQGESVMDIAALKRVGINPSDLSRTIAEIFTEMIFMFGDVHCDPHAANLMVRKKDGRPQLVLLDHGLYRRIDDDFRLRYARLWQSLIKGDEPAIKENAEAMNAGDMYPLFVAMLTLRPWDQVVNQSSPDKLFVADTVEHRRRVQSHAMEHAVDITTMLTRVPRPLLLLLKTNDCLRSVDTSLGQPVNNIVVTARECTRAIEEHRLKTSDARGLRKLWTRTVVTWEVAKVELRMGLLRFVASLPTWVTSWRPQSSSPDATGDALAATSGSAQ